MYHCQIQFCLFSHQGSSFQAVKEKDPLEHFSHTFCEINVLEEEPVSRANVILADLQGVDGKEALAFFIAHKKKEAVLILLASKEQIALLSEQELSEVTDIWGLPLTEEELSFHFLRWQQNYKQSKDLWQAQNFLDATINSVPHLIWYKDKNGAHIKVNESFCQAVNKTMEQIQGRGHYYIWDIEPDEYVKGEYICMESEFEVMEKRQTCIFDEMVKIGEDMKQLQTYKSPLFDIDGKVMGTVGVAMDVTQERIYEQMIINNANTDFLTGLYNRRYVYQFIEKEMGKSLAIYYLDLDNFKKVNDMYGHQEGDRALLITTEVLQKCMPEAMIARIGGDEFLVVQAGSNDTEEEIEDKRKWLQEQLDKTYAAEEHFKDISASIGTAYSPEGEVIMDALIGEADAFMYRIKNQKKGLQ
ncbi:MAG: sensor domain-containing diguanylate cyclase [Lachnospiraceae bacterium]|nr:sensor domain-containing diguanylate cyclase [Lachnospiraceae bacterium]